MKFGTSGLRGLSVDLTGRASALYAMAFGKYLLQSNKAAQGDVILIGRDFRESSPEIAGNCAGALASLSPRRPKAIGGPGAAQCVRQDKRALAARRIKQGPQRRASGHCNPATTFRLAKTNVRALVGRPGEAQKVPLPLPAP